MNSLNELFFNHSAAEGMTYEDILDDVQKYCTANHADTLSGETDPEQAKKASQRIHSPIPDKMQLWSRRNVLRRIMRKPLRGYGRLLFPEKMDLPERCGGSK